MTSPYSGLPEPEWATITEQLIRAYPLSTELLTRAVLRSWDAIFQSTIGPLQIGKDILPQPQTMGFFLHELIPVEVAAMAVGWRRGRPPVEKDLHCEFDSRLSVEIKTSSNPSRVFGNRSYAQEATENSRQKSGYFLTVNFQKFPLGTARPEILLVRFGWLDHEDWRGQAAATGQQASLRPQAYNYKLKTIYARPGIRLS